jgi:hypothetical protein
METKTGMTGALKDSTSLRVILLVSVSFFALVVGFHDYPGHDHFSFAHELLSKDAPVEKGDSDPEQEQIKWGWEKGMVPVVDTSVHDGYPSISIVCLQRGFDHLSSGLAPPAGVVRLVPRLSSLHIHNVSNHSSQQRSIITGSDAFHFDFDRGGALL